MGGPVYDKKVFLYNHSITTFKTIDYEHAIKMKDHEIYENVKL